jgi:hypothetical protein
MAIAAQSVDPECPSREDAAQTPRHKRNHDHERYNLATISIHRLL